MSNSKSLLGRLWRRLFPISSQPQPVRPREGSQRPLPRRSHVEQRGIEPLEGRIAPATLLPGGKSITYTDIDGDLVTIQFSKALFSPQDGGSSDSILQQVFTFSAGKAHTGSPNATDDVPQLLQKIDLTRVYIGFGTSPVNGVSFSITAHQQDANDDGVLEGNGKANVGAIAATNLALGNVSVDGDLGQIDAGKASSKVALKSLDVDSLGKLTNTQVGSSSTYESLIVGSIGSFTADTVEGGYLRVTDGTSLDGRLTAPGNIGSVVIAHYIKARDPLVAVINDGRLDVAGNIGSLIIGAGLRDPASAFLSDGMNGGRGANSASVNVVGSIGSVLIDGDMRGGSGNGSGSITAGTIKTLEVKGAMIGDGASSAAVTARLSLGNATVGLLNGPGLVGGAGGLSATISSGGSIGSVHLSNVLGEGANSAGVTAEGKIGSVTIDGSLKGGAIVHSGFIESFSSIGSIQIGGNLEGAAGVRSGVIVAGGNIDKLTIGGQVLGGTGAQSASITSVGGLGVVKIGDGLLGGAGLGSAVVSAGTTIKDLSIGRTTPNAPDAILGGTGASSGGVYAYGGITKISLDGSLQGGAGDYSGTIRTQGLLKTLSISGDVLGGAGLSSGAIEAFDYTSGNGKAVAGALGNITVSGVLKGGTGAKSGVISSDGSIQSVSLGYFFRGSDVSSGRIVAGAGFTAVGNIGSISLGFSGLPALAVGEIVVLPFPTTPTSPVQSEVDQPGGTVVATGSITSLNASLLFQSEVRVGQSIASILVRNGVTDSIISAAGNVDATGASDLAIAKILIDGPVRDSSILAGYGVTGAAENGHAQIGSVRVTGSWTDSNLVAGVRDVAGDGFGNADDALIASGPSKAISKINSVIIEGLMLTSEAGQYGFVAQEIGSFRVGTNTLALAKPAAGQLFELLSEQAQSRATVREILAPLPTMA